MESAEKLVSWMMENYGIHGHGSLTSTPVQLMCFFFLRMEESESLRQSSHSTPSGVVKSMAQICDYALALQEKPYEELPEKPMTNNTELPTENDIRESLSIGDFLLIVAGDQIDPRALRLGTAILAGHLTSEWEY